MCCTGNAVRGGALDQQDLELRDDILVYTSDLVRPSIRYSVGDLAPDELSRYVHIVGGSEVVSIPDYQIRNLRELLEMVTAQPASEPAATS